MLSLAAAAYVAVLTAELAGDKLLYTVGVLAARHRPGRILAGAAAAFLVKVAAAAALGEALGELPTWLIRGAGAVTFLALAWAALRRKDEAPADEAPSSGGAWATFAALVSSEWADPGQLAVAALVARFRAPVVIGVAAMLALLTKCAFALGLGTALRRWLPPKPLRWASLAVCLAMAIAVTVER